MEEGQQENETINTREKFEIEKLRPIMRRVLNAELTNASYEDLDKESTTRIAHKIKQAMLEISPSDYKYIVLVNASKNNNQGGRVDASMHWEMDADTFVQDIYQSVSDFVII